MNVYPKEYVPTTTPPDSDGALGERLASSFGQVMWPDGYPGRRAVRRPPPGPAATRSSVVHEPIAPPDLYDREFEKDLAAPKLTASIGRWHRRPRTVKV